MVVSMDRCLTMAAYSAFVAMQRYLEKNPDSTPEQAVKIIQSTSPDDAGHDYIGGRQIYSYMSNQLIAGKIQQDLRFVIGEIVRIYNPWWLRLVPYGREKLKSVLDVNQVQCFTVAGLFEAVPDADSISWWDEMAALVRGAEESERMIQAREAEFLSLEYEKARLETLSINREPLWVSLEDNTLGYDILSYDKGSNGVVNRLIEVKRTASNSIFVTRNEWNNALSARQNYLFHIWHMPSRKFIEYSVKSMKTNIPKDQGTGVWQNVFVNL